MHESASEMMVDLLEYLPRTQLKIIDIGSRDVNGCLRPLVEAVPGWKYTGLDIRNGKNVDIVVGDPHRWPEIKADSYDAVISGQVLEHVPKPWLWIREIARIVRPGGFVVIMAPNTWEYHKYPDDCWRVWPEGLKALFDEAGLVTVKAFCEGPDTGGVAKKPPSVAKVAKITKKPQPAGGIAKKPPFVGRRARKPPFAGRRFR